MTAHNTTGITPSDRADAEALATTLGIMLDMVYYGWDEDRKIWIAVKHTPTGMVKFAENAGGAIGWVEEPDP